MNAITRTAAETRQLRIAAMGEPLGSLMSALDQETAWLHLKWQQYATLYGTSEERVHLLNKAASQFFYVVQEVLWDDAVLHLTCLVAPPKSAGRDNLTICRLQPLIDHRPTADLVGTLTATARDAIENFSAHRNRRIAHFDLAHALENGADPLPPTSRASFRIALQAVVDVLNAVDQHYLEKTNFFNAFDGDPGGAETLLHVIDDGLLVHAARMKEPFGGTVAFDKRGSRKV